MRLFRSLSIAVAGVTTVASVAAMAPAGAAEPGLGTAATTTKLVSAAVGANGSLLNLVLGSDEARSTIDSAVASPSAFSRLSVADISSGVVSALNVKVPATPLEAKAPEGPTSVTAPASNLLPAEIPSVLGSGTVDVPSLTASLDGGFAKSALSGGVSGVNLVGGLIGIDKVATNLTSAASPDSADANRAAVVQNITVLDLDALLSGLGISLPDLSVAQLTGLVDTLGATAGLDLNGSATVGAAAASLQAAISDLNAELGSLTGATTPVTSVVDSTTSTLLGTVGITSPLNTGGTVATTVGAVQDVITQLQGVLDDLLAGSINNLLSTPLLQLEGVEVGVVASALDTVEASKAAVTAKIGAVKVGALSLPGVDLLSSVSAVTDVVNQAQAKLDSVLGVLGLNGLVKVSLLDKVESVTASGGYVRSRAGVTAATATITPPAALADLLNTVGAAADSVAVDTVGEVIESVGGTVPQLSTAMSTLTSTLSLGGTLSALSQGATVRVAEVLSASDFRRPGVTPGAPVTPTTPELPRTGGPAQLALLGGMAAVLALGLRRFLHQPAVRVVRTK